MKILLVAAITLMPAFAAEGRNRATLGTMSLESTPQMEALEAEADTIWHAMFASVPMVYSYRLGGRIAPPWPQMDRSVTLYASTKVTVQKVRCGIWPGDPQCIFLYGQFYTVQTPSVNKAAR